MKVRKAVIPAAGLGTRFLPATKAVPKELLPIVDIPTIQYIVQEAVEAGIETVVLISGRGKSSIVDHFDHFPSLEEKLEQTGKGELAEMLRNLGQMVDLVSVRQGKPLGLGHAVHCAKSIIGDEPFAVLLGDDMVDHEVPCTKQMTEIYSRFEQSIVALMPVSDDDVSKFGICAGSEKEERLIQVDKIVEKPALKDAPSNTAIVGRYILTSRIFEMLEHTKPGKGGEIQLTDALHAMMREDGLLGYHFLGQRYDAGDKFGFVQANIAYALKRDGLREQLLDYMRECLEKNA